MSFKVGDVQLLAISNFHGGAASLDFFLKAYKIVVPALEATQKMVDF